LLKKRGEREMIRKDLKKIAVTQTPTLPIQVDENRFPVQVPPSTHDHEPAIVKPVKKEHDCPPVL